RRRTVVERVCRRCGGDARRDADQSVPPGWDGGGPSSRAGGDCRGATAAAVPDVAANRGVGPRGVESRIPGGTVRAAISLTTARWPADQPSRTKVTFRITRYPTILPSSMITFWLWTHASVTLRRVLLARATPWATASSKLFLDSQISSETFATDLTTSGEWV